MEKHGKHLIIMLFKGILSELMVLVYPNMYRKYVTYDINGNVMFVCGNEEGLVLPIAKCTDFLQENW